MDDLLFRNILNDAKIVTDKDIHTVRGDDMTMLVITHISAIQPLELNHDDKILLQIFTFMHADTEYYCLYLNVQNRHIYILMDTLKYQSEIESIAQIDKILLSSQTILEKSLEPENVYKGSVLLTKQDYITQHELCMSKVTKPDQQENLYEHAKVIDLACNDFEQCIDITLDSSVGLLLNQIIVQACHIDSNNTPYGRLHFTANGKQWQLEIQDENIKHISTEQYGINLICGKEKVYIDSHDLTQVMSYGLS